MVVSARPLFHYDKFKPFNPSPVQKTSEATPPSTTDTEKRQKEDRPARINVKTGDLDFFSKKVNSEHLPKRVHSEKDSPSNSFAVFKKTFSDPLSSPKLEVPQLQRSVSASQLFDPAIFSSTEDSFSLLDIIKEQPPSEPAQSKEDCFSFLDTTEEQQTEDNSSNDITEQCYDFTEDWISSCLYTSSKSEEPGIVQRNEFPLADTPSLLVKLRGTKRKGKSEEDPYRALLTKTGQIILNYIREKIEVWPDGILCGNFIQSQHVKFKAYITEKRMKECPRYAPFERAFYLAFPSLDALDEYAIVSKEKLETELESLQLKLDDMLYDPLTATMKKYIARKLVSPEYWPYGKTTSLILFHKKFLEWSDTQQILRCTLSDFTKNLNQWLPSVSINKNIVTIPSYTVCCTEFATTKALDSMRIYLHIQ